MTKPLWVVLGLLCAWGFITIVRRIGEEQEREKLQDGEQGSRSEPGSLRDSIDWDELERAEDEVREIDPEAKPEDGFEGDDWGPGSVPRPPLA